jgi:hypothetical protein
MKKRKIRISQEILDIAIALKKCGDNRNPLDILIEKEERELPKKTMKQIIKEVGGTV